MPILPTVTIGVLLVAALLVAVFKGSRPPQPIPTTPTSRKRAMFAAFMSVACAAILLVTLTSLGPYVSEHFAPPRPMIILFVGVIAPWFVGIYFAYKAARAENKALRAIGASEVLIFLLAATLSLMSR